MRIPLFAIVIVFVIWLNIKNHISSRRDEDVTRAFWERENAANRTRKQPLDTLSYITIPEDLLPDRAFDPAFSACAAAGRIRSLREEEAVIVNLTGYTNTDLKLEYGVANLPLLSEYDAHYTALVTAVQEVAEALYEEERFPEALRLLEFEARTGTDISACYRMLVELYRNNPDMPPEQADERISALLPVAQSLRSLSRDGIVRMLEDALQTKAVTPSVQTSGKKDTDPTDSTPGTPDPAPYRSPSPE